MKAMKNLALAACAALTVNIAWTQNLVPNPGFEEVDFCVTKEIIDDNNIEAATGWTFANTGTSNHYHPCHSANVAQFGTPTNFQGYQVPLGGDAYAGIVTMGDTVPFGGTYREYIQVQLTSPLIQGHNYHIGFYCNLSDVSALAADRIGMFLSSDAVSAEGTGHIDAIPQLEHTEFVSDSVEWTEVSGFFVATGGEQFVTIGNFRNAQDTDYNTLDPFDFIPSSYYYIDDVFVVDSTEIPNHVYEQELKVHVFPNPVEGKLFIEGLDEDSKILLFNSRSELVMEMVARKDAMLDTSTLDQGMYILKISNSKGLITRRVIVEKMSELKTVQF